MTNYIYWSKTTLTGGGATALDGITGMTAGDFCHTCVSGSLYVHKCITSSATESSPDLITPDAGGSVRWQLQKAYSALPTGFISGLTMSHDTYTDHDISIAAGKCRDSTDAADIVLSSAIVKKADAAWVVGTTKGGMDTGSIPASATLHVWLIKRSDTGVVDALFSISATSPTMPASYDYKRRIGSYRTDASSNIINGDYWGSSNFRRFLFDTPIRDVNATNPGTSAVLGAGSTLSVPAGLNVGAIIEYRLSNTGVTSTGTVKVSSPANADASNWGAVSYTWQSAPYSGPVITNTSSQIRYKCSASDASQTLEIWTIGWEDYL